MARLCGIRITLLQFRSLFSFTLPKPLESLILAPSRDKVHIHSILQCFEKCLHLWSESQPRLHIERTCLCSINPFLLRCACRSHAPDLSEARGCDTNFGFYNLTPYRKSFRRASCKHIYQSMFPSQRQTASTGPESVFLYVVGKDYNPTGGCLTSFSPPLTRAESFWRMLAVYLPPSTS